MSRKASDENSELSAEYVLEAIETALSNLPIPICIYDKDDRPLVCSDAYRQTFFPQLDSTLKHLYAQNIKYGDLLWAKLSAEEAAPEVKRRFEREMARHRIEGGFTKDMMINGKWSRRTKSISKDGHLVSLAVPIDEMVQKTEALADAKKDMEHQAYHDPLTDLPNRRALNNYLSKLLKEGGGKAENTAVLHVDLDKFKLVNDSLGHDAGDCVLLAASRILTSELRSTDFVSRIGGDEFVLVCRNVKDRDGIGRLAQRIIDRMAEPIYYGEDACQIGASIGIALCEEFTTPERIVMDADIALYDAKRAGRGQFAFFYPSRRDKFAAFQRKIVQVREAVALNAFEPFFQPQICANTGALTGFEALARLRDRENGIKHPAEFMEALVEANLLNELDTMMIDKSLRRLAEWDEMGLDIPTISLNLSSSILARPKMAHHLKWACDSAGISPKRISLEILETVFLDDLNGEIAQNLKDLKHEGFTISLDDFGTGHAAISSLRSLSPDLIKIDREFVSHIDEDKDLQMITGALIALAQKLGIKVFCEGVETVEEEAMLRSLGCEFLQGYLFSKPMEASRVPIWVEEYLDTRVSVTQVA